MKMMNWLLLFALSAITVVSFMVPGVEGFQQPDFARLIFFHVPCAIISFVFQCMGAWAGFKYLKTRSSDWEIKCASAIEMSCLMAGLTLITGMMFSKSQWGAWWQWDPRQTSYLIQFLILCAGLLLRNSLGEENSRKKGFVSYVLIGFLPALFLIFVFPRLPHIEQSSFHPSQTLIRGQLDMTYSWVLRGVGILLFCFCLKIFRLRAHTEILENKLEEKLDDRNLENTRSSATFSRLDSTVSIHQKN